MGRVYEAVRDDDQFHKRVALKMVKPGRETGSVLRRFRYERRDPRRPRPPPHRGAVRRRRHRRRPSLLRDGVRRGRADRPVLRVPQPERGRAAGAVRQRVRRGAARPPQSRGAPRPQAEQHPGDRRRRREAARLRHRQAAPRRRRRRRSHRDRRPRDDRGLRQPGAGARRRRSPPRATSTRSASCSSSCWPDSDRIVSTACRPPT